MGYSMWQTGSNLKLKPGKFEELKKIVDAEHYFELQAKTEAEWNKFGCPIYFVGEKASDDAEDMLKDFANCFENQSWFQFSGEDGEFWRYVYCDNKMHIIYPEIVWPEVISKAINTKLIE